MAYSKKQQLKPRGRLRSKRSLATGIPKHVRQEVLVRDRRCVICGSMHQIEIHHLVERSRLGMGVDNNLVSLCRQCHRDIHNGDTGKKTFIRNYLERLYPDITDNMRKYKKH